MILSAGSQSPRQPLGPLQGAFHTDGNSRFKCSIDLLMLVSESLNRESCPGCRRIRSKIASRGITRICAVTEFNNIYRGWANRTVNLPFGSVCLLLYKGQRAALKSSLWCTSFHGVLHAQYLVNGRLAPPHPARCSRGRGAHGGARIGRGLDQILSLPFKL